MNGFFKFVLEVIKMAALAFLIVFPIRYFLFQPFIVNGTSMAPSFETADYLFIDEISFRFREPERGEVVVFKAPLEPKDRYIKRIIGLPGETVNVSNGLVYITQTEKFLLDESEYLLEDTVTHGEVSVILGEKEYFVMGDNRQFSSDSRRWGVLPKENIVGRAFFRLLPFKNILVISEPEYSLAQ